MFKELPQTLDALEASATAPLDVLQNLPAEEQPEVLFYAIMQQIAEDTEFLSVISGDETFPTPLRTAAFASLLTFFDNIQTTNFSSQETQNGLDWVRRVATGQTDLELKNTDRILAGYVLEKTPRHILAPGQIIFTGIPKKGATVDDPYVAGAIAFLGDGQTALYFHTPAYGFLAEFDSEGNFIPKFSEQYVPLYWETETIGSLNTNGLFYDRTHASRRRQQILTPPEHL